MRNVYDGKPSFRKSNLIIPQGGVTPIFNLGRRPQKVGPGFRFLPQTSMALEKAFPIDLARLRDTCERPSGSFAQEMDVGMLTPHGSLYYKDNGANILAVAHMDTVLSYNRTELIQTGSGDLVFSSTLDNRLGVYLLLYYLNELGVKTDILLTDNEEIVRSSARYFVVGKKYNWAFSFDRPDKDGLDTVLYQYDDEDIRSKLRDVGITTSTRGSYSDIKELEHLGIKCINFNNGVKLSHDYSAFTNLKRLYITITKFLAFYEAYKDVHLPHISVLAMNAIKANDPRVYERYTDRRRYVNIPLMLQPATPKFTLHQVDLPEEEPFVVPPVKLNAEVISKGLHKSELNNQVKSVKPLYTPPVDSEENLHHVFECEACHDFYTEAVLYADDITSVYCKKCREDILEEDSLFDQSEIIRESEVEEIIIQGKPTLVEKDDLLNGIIKNYEFKKAGKGQYAFFQRSGFKLPSDEVGFVAEPFRRLH